MLPRTARVATTGEGPAPAPPLPPFLPAPVFAAASGGASSLVIAARLRYRTTATTAKITQPIQRYFDGGLGGGRGGIPLDVRGRGFSGAGRELCCSGGVELWSIMARSAVKA